MLISFAKSPGTGDFAAHYFDVTRSALFIPSRGDLLMSQHSGELITQLRASLAQQRYSAMVIHNYCVNAQSFLRHLAEQRIALEVVTPQHVADYLRDATAGFRERHGRDPARYWRSIPRSGIHAMLKLALPQWPPSPASSPAEITCARLCEEFAEWQRVERGLAPKSIVDLMWEVRFFLAWRVARGAADIGTLTIEDIDAYFAERAPKLRRRSIKDTAQRLRALVRFLHATGRIPTDIAPQIISPTMYAYEAIPSALSQDEIDAALAATRQDVSPVGLRDYAILMLLATYGVRAGEIMQLDSTTSIGAPRRCACAIQRRAPRRCCRSRCRWVRRCWLIYSVAGQRPIAERCSFASERPICRCARSTARCGGVWRPPA